VSTRVVSDWIFKRRVAEAVWTGEPESVTWNVIKPPVVVSGVPLMSPVAEFSVRPDGSRPVATDHVNGPVPPVAVNVNEYGEFTAPSGKAVVVMARGPAPTAKLKVRDAVCAGEPESVTLKVSEAEPGAVGVPLIAPDGGFRFSPAGSVPAVNCHVYAPVPPVAAKTCE